MPDPAHPWVVRSRPDTHLRTSAGRSRHPIAGPQRFPTMDAVQPLVSAALVATIALFTLANLDLALTEIRGDLRAARAAARARR